MWLMWLNEHNPIGGYNNSTGGNKSKMVFSTSTYEYDGSNYGHTIGHAV